MYQPGKQNAKADALTRRDQEVEIQDGIKTEYRTKAFLTRDQVDPQVLKDLGIETETNELAPMGEPFWDEPIELVDRILRQNREAPSLQALREQALREDSEFTIEDGLLLNSRRLVVPDTDYLRTELIKEAHNQVSTAHPGKDKTYRLLRPRYYWQQMLPNVAQFVRNCHECKRADIPRDKTPGFLHPLPVPEHPWQHVTMDFKSMPKDKHRFDMVFVVINRLSKKD